MNIEATTNSQIDRATLVALLAGVDCTIRGNSVTGHGMHAGVKVRYALQDAGYKIKESFGKGGIRYTITGKETQA